MEHDQRVCPRCGEPAGDYSFCHSCRSQLDSLTGISTLAAAHAADSVYPGSRALAEVLRLEEALAASKGISDRIAARASAAVEVDPDPLSASNAERVTETTHPPRDVARLEDVLTVDPSAANAAAAADPEPAQIEADETAAIDQVEYPTRADRHPAEPTYVAARALREAFWFEQASAFKQIGSAIHAADRDRNAAEDTTNEAHPVQSEPDAAPGEQQDSSQSVLASLVGQAPRNRWAAALCVLAVIVLVALLTGRDPRRFAGVGPR